MLDLHQGDAIANWEAQRQESQKIVFNPIETISVPNPNHNPTGFYPNHKRDWADVEKPRPLEITSYNIAEAIAGLYAGSTYLAECLLLTAKPSQRKRKSQPATKYKKAQLSLF